MESLHTRSVSQDAFSTSVTIPVVSLSATVSLLDLTELPHDASIIAQAAIVSERDFSFICNYDWLTIF